MRGDQGPSPAEFLRRAKEENGDCLGELLQLYSNYLRILASTQIDTRLRARLSPSDVIQETFFEAHRDFHQFRGKTEGEFLGWLRRILANNLARAVEKHLLAARRDVRKEVSLNAIEAALDRSTARLEAVIEDHGASPSSIAQNREQTVIVADQLSKLSPDYRQVLVLRHLESLSFAQVADQMGRSEGAVRMLWLRAIRQFREMMNAKGMT